MQNNKFRFNQSKLFFQDFNPPNRDFYAHNDSKKEYIMQKTHAYNVLIIHEMQTNMR